MNFKLMTSQAVQGTWICTARFRGESVMLKKLLVSQYFFNVLASKVKNPKWPEANQLNGYIYKHGHSWDFSKGMHKLFSPSSPTHLKTPNHFKVSYI